jgi:hypothetical protein
LENGPSLLASFAQRLRGGTAFGGGLSPAATPVKLVVDPV